MVDVGNTPPPVPPPAPAPDDQAATASDVSVTDAAPVGDAGTPIDNGPITNTAGRPVTVQPTVPEPPPAKVDVYKAQAVNVAKQANTPKPAEVDPNATGRVQQQRVAADKAAVSGAKAARTDADKWAELRREAAIKETKRVLSTSEDYSYKRLDLNARSASAQYGVQFKGDLQEAEMQRFANDFEASFAKMTPEQQKMYRGATIVAVDGKNPADPNDNAVILMGPKGEKTIAFFKPGQQALAARNAESSHLLEHEAAHETWFHTEDAQRQKVMESIGWKLNAKTGEFEPGKDALFTMHEDGQTPADQQEAFAEAVEHANRGDLTPAQTQAVRQAIATAHDERVEEPQGEEVGFEVSDAAKAAGEVGSGDADRIEQKVDQGTFAIIDGLPGLTDAAKDSLKALPTEQRVSVLKGMMGDRIKSQEASVKASEKEVEGVKVSIDGRDVPYAEAMKKKVDLLTEKARIDAKPVASRSAAETARLGVLATEIGKYDAPLTAKKAEYDAAVAKLADERATLRGYGEWKKALELAPDALGKASALRSDPSDAEARSDARLYLRSGAADAVASGSGSAAESRLEAGQQQLAMQSGQPVEGYGRGTRSNLRQFRDDAGLANDTLSNTNSAIYAFRDLKETLHPSSGSGDSLGLLSGNYNLGLMSSMGDTRAQQRKLDRIIQQLLQAIAAGNSDAITWLLIVIAGQSKRTMLRAALSIGQHLVVYERQQRVINQKIASLNPKGERYQSNMTNLNSDMQLIASNRQMVINSLREITTTNEELENIAKSHLDVRGPHTRGLSRWTA